MSRVRAIVLGPEAQLPVVLESGDAQAPVFWRSAAKFIQALSLYASGAVEQFGFTDEEVALACASHSGGDEHVAGVARMMQKVGLTADDLHCGPHTPLGTAEAKALAERGEAPSRLHNNCSGKHTGMLAVCRARGWPLADYNRLHHPLQQEILRHLSQVADVPVDQIGTAVDGCGAVVFRTPLAGLARAYHRLLHGALPAPHREAGQRILAALRRAPQMIAGQGRLCSNLIEISDGKLVGKVGAEGIYALGGTGLGALAVKIEDGHSRHVDAVVCQLAAQLGWLNRSQLQALKPHWHQPIFNHQRELVGEILVRIGV